MTHDIFISYTQPDRHTAFAIYDALIRNGMKVWIAGSVTDGVKAGNAYKKDVVSAIAACKIFLLVYSKYVNMSRDVKSELTLAEKKIIIPIRMDQSEMCAELKYDLKNLEFIDADRGGIAYIMSRLLCDIPHHLETYEESPKALLYKTPLAVRLKKIAITIAILITTAAMFLILFNISPNRKVLPGKQQAIIQDSLFVSGIIRARNTDMGIANAWLTSDLTPGDTLTTTTDGTFEFAVKGKPGQSIRIYTGAEGFITRNEYHTLPKAISIYLDKQ
ncbi:MAG: toll/interleukin-1 receptor domain-containing protein [Chitinophagaceae bacterium]